MSTPNHQIMSMDVVVIMDESGSMASMGDEPVQAVTEYIKNEQKDSDSYTTLDITFFSTYVRKVCVDTSLSDFESFPLYKPDGMTSLNDAVYSTIKDKLMSTRSDNVVCLIVTDGKENASRNTTREDVKNIIEEAETEHGWKVIYLGANQDAFKEGETMSLPSERCGNYRVDIPGDLIELVRSASNATSNYRRSGQLSL